MGVMKQWKVRMQDDCLASPPLLLKVSSEKESLGPEPVATSPVNGYEYSVESAGLVMWLVEDGLSATRPMLPQHM